MSYADAAHPRWDGTPGRTEIWYASITEPRTGTGIWVHYELVAPESRGGAPYRHGWIAVFESDAEPACERFGPEPVSEADAGRTVWFPGHVAEIGPDAMSGRAGEIGWEIGWHSTAPPLWTFPKLAWNRELLPGAQCVPVPTGAFSGHVTVGDHHLDLHDAPGNVAHVYGHGSPKEWGWLHADLGDHDVLEVVTAVSMTPGLDRLPPSAFLRLRTDGQDWPRRPLPVLRSTSVLGEHDWSVRGRIGRQRLTIEVSQPPERSVALCYVDPDGETATCTNSAVSDATVTVEERAGGSWHTLHEWRLDGTAHAEFGVRP
ncbi:MAG: hypothetical protein U5K30_13465 [Acidimicrobiales bacterium]|nr:hypothetical protein [Acidimicrobiales bacterium]